MAERATAEGDGALDNVVWHALTTTHARFGEGDDGARRYDPEVSVFWGAPDAGAGSWEAMAALARPGDVAVVFRRVVGDIPEGWAVERSGVGHQLVLRRPVVPVTAPEGLRPLTTADVPAMLELVGLTAPGPFAPRTIELGGYVGVVEDGRLLAMAGERMAVPGHSEVSAVCTHPDARRRGYGAALTAHVAAGIQARGETPFLHVVTGNDGARRVYTQLGFTHRCDVGFAGLRRLAAG